MTVRGVLVITFRDQSELKHIKHKKYPVYKIGLRLSQEVEHADDDHDDKVLIHDIVKSHQMDCEDEILVSDLLIANLEECLGRELVYEELIDQIEYLKHDQDHPIIGVGCVPKVDGIPFLPSGLGSILEQVEPLQPFKHVFIILILHVSETKVILAQNEESHKNGKQLTRLPVEILGGCVNHKENHETYVPHTIQVVGPIQKQSNQDQRLNILKHEENELPCN